MLDSIVEPATGKLSHVASAIPDVGQERMPGRGVSVMPDIGAVGAAIVELQEIRAVPRSVQRIFRGIKIIRRSLKICITV